MKHFLTKLRHPPCGRLALVIMTALVLFFAFTANGFLNERHNAIVSSSRSVFGDWAVHSIYAHVFAFRSPDQWFIQHPIVAGAPFNYPFMSSLISGLLMRTGVSLAHSLALASGFFLITLALVLFAFYRQLLVSSTKAAWGVTLFFFGGGFAWILFARDLANSPNLASAWSLILFPAKEYAGSHKLFEYGSSLFSMLIPQRAMALGMTMVVAVLYFLHKNSLQLKDTARFKLVVAGLTVGLLPIAHVHSAMVIAIVSAVYGWQQRREWRSLLFYMVPAAVLGAAMILIFIQPFGKLPDDVTKISQSFAAWQLGWLAHGRPWTDKLMFWIYNWGPFCPLVILALMHTTWRRSPFVIAGITIFVLANLFRFQPWDWDNTKLFIYAYLLLVPVVIDYLSLLWNLKKHLKWPRLVTIALFMAMTATGATEVMRLINWRTDPVGIWSREDIENAAKARTIIPAGKLVLTSVKHNDWLATLTGAQILMGYPGWTWSYGFNTGLRESNIATIFKGGPDATRLLQHYKIDYVVLNRMSRGEYKVDETYFEQNFTRVLNQQGATIYQITK